MASIAFFAERPSRSLCGAGSLSVAGSLDRRTQPSGEQHTWVKNVAISARGSASSRLAIDQAPGQFTWIPAAEPAVPLQEQ